METVQAEARQRQAAADDLVDRLVAEIEPLERRHNEALWRSSLTGDPAEVEESGRLDAALRRIFARREPLEGLGRLLAAGGVEDASLQRQLVLLHHAFSAHQNDDATIDAIVGLEKSLESRFSNFRAELDGQRVSDNRIREILKGSDDDDERRRAWDASKQVGRQVQAELLELVRWRNQTARRAGHENYYSMMLALDELPERELLEILVGLDRGTREAFRGYKRELDARLARRFGVAAAELQPWHYADPFFQVAPAAGVDLDPWFRERSLPEIANAFFAAVGFEIGDLFERADLYERPGKSQHAFCLSVDRGGDIRVLCNLRGNESWMSTLLHEFGHAVYDQSIERSLPYLLRLPAHTFTTEASAMLFGRLSKNATWLERYAGMPGDVARKVEVETRRAMRDQLLVQARWWLVMCHMERELYRDPDRDLDGLWWDLVEEYQEVRRPQARREPDWASKIHFSLAPVYYHNYMLGEMLASQLQDHLRRVVLGGGDDIDRRYVSGPEVGAYLRESVYQAGKSTDWREAVRRATGRPLTAESLGRDLAPPD